MIMIMIMMIIKMIMIRRRCLPSEKGVLTASMTVRRAGKEDEKEIVRKNLGDTLQLQNIRKAKRLEKAKISAIR